LLTQNQIESNRTGLFLCCLNPNVRVEGNTIAANRIGLWQASESAETESHLAALGIPELTVETAAVPVLANNVFMKNTELDIRNETRVPLPAAGNWWGEEYSRDPARAAVSDGVRLEQSAWQGVIAVGTESTDVRMLLGRILQYTLAEMGYRVIDLIGMGPSDRVQQALAESDVNLVLWSRPHFDASSMDGEAATTVVPSSAVEGWRLVISAQLADELAEPTASGLSSWFSQTGNQLRFAAVSSFDETALDAFLATYNLTNAKRSFTQADSLEEVEALLKFGAVDVAIVGNLEETLTIAGFLAIEDTDNVLNATPIAMVLHPAMVADQSAIAAILEALGERLTTAVLHDLVSRVRLLHQDPKRVALEFVQQ